MRTPRKGRWLLSGLMGLSAVALGQKPVEDLTHRVAWQMVCQIDGLGGLVSGSPAVAEGL